MQTRTAAILIFVGALLLYLGVFGLVIPFRFAVTGSPEDFSTYTEVDPNSHISKTATHIDHVGYSNEDCYLYKDKGANHFADFVHLMDVKFVSSGSAQYGHSLYSLSNDVDDWKGLVDTGKTAIGIIGEHASEYPYLLFVVEAYGGVQYSSGPSPVPIPEKEKLAENTWYYLNLVKSGTSLTLTIYSDAARINLVNTKSILLHANHQFRYVFGVNSLNEPLNAWCEVYWDNLYLQEGSAPPTYSDVTISVSGQGTTSPAAGHYPSTYLVGGSLTITTVPASGWAFDYMTRNGYTAPTLTLNSLGASEYIVVYFKTGPSTTGTLRVFASYNGAYVVASITATGPQTVSGSTTTSSANPLAFTVTAGTYTVSGSYSSGSAAPQTVTVTAGGSVDANLNFGGPSPTPDPLEFIKQLLQNAVLKSMFVLAGVLLTGIGVIGLLPSRKTSRPTAYSPYY